MLLSSLLSKSSLINQENFIVMRKPPCSLDYLVIDPCISSSLLQESEAKEAVASCEWSECMHASPASDDTYYCPSEIVGISALTILKSCSFNLLNSIGYVFICLAMCAKAFSVLKEDVTDNSIAVILFSSFVSFLQVFF